MKITDARLLAAMNAYDPQFATDDISDYAEEHQTDMRNALEAALSEEDTDWEYALQADDDEPWSNYYESRELLADNLDGLSDRDDERLMRRRKAGPWEPVE